MKSAFHRFVDNIVQQTDGTQEEKEDLQEELVTHLQLASEQFIKEGFEPEEADRKAMAHFGDADNIGSQIQQAMFPFRKEMMLILAFASILFSFSVYVAQLFIEGDAYIFWLILSIIVSTCVLIFALRPLSFLNRRLWLNSLFIVHIFLYFFGVLLAGGVTRPISAILTILAWLIVLLGIVLVYRTTIYDYPPKRHIRKQVIWLHGINITIGITVVGFTLFFLWVMLAFTDEFNPRMFLSLLPLLIWLISYIVQMRLLARGKKKTSYVVAAVPLFMLFIIFIWVFSPLPSY